MELNIHTQAAELNKLVDALTRAYDHYTDALRLEASASDHADRVWASKPDSARDSGICSHIAAFSKAIQKRTTARSRLLMRFDVLNTAIERLEEFGVSATVILPERPEAPVFGEPSTSATDNKDVAGDTNSDPLTDAIKRFLEDIPLDKTSIKLFCDGKLLYEDVFNGGVDLTDIIGSGDLASVFDAVFPRPAGKHYPKEKSNSSLSSILADLLGELNDREMRDLSNGIFGSSHTPRRSGFRHGSPFGRNPFTQHVDAPPSNMR